MEEVGQRRTGGNHVARRAGIDTLDEAARARLHDAHVALVELHRGHRLDGGADGAPLGRGQPHAQRLQGLRRHADAGRSGLGLTLVGITRHQLHVHERRLAGLVEALRRHHGVVPVQHLAFGGRRCRTGGFGRRREVAARPGRQPPAGRATQHQQDNSPGDLVQRAHGVCSAIKVFRRTCRSLRSASSASARRRSSSRLLRAASTAASSLRPAW